jgi:hypothetical protein
MKPKVPVHWKEDSRTEDAKSAVKRVRHVDESAQDEIDTGG